MNSPTVLRGTKSTFFALIVSLQPLAQIRIAEGEEVRQTSLEVLLAFRVAVASRGGSRNGYPVGGPRCSRRARAYA